MSLSIVLTCYNEVPLIFESYRTLAAMMKSTNIDHEFIVVDDGSMEEVQRCLKGFFHESRARLILSPENEGRGAAVTKGIRVATKEYVCFIDTDLEIPAHAVLVLYCTGIVLGADMVIAERVYRLDLSPKHIIRSLGSVGLKFVSSMMLRLGKLDTETGAKLFRRRAMMDVLEDVSNTRWFWDTEIVAEALKRSQRVVQVPIVVRRRSDKGSSVHLLGDTWNYLKAMFEYKQGVKGKCRAAKREIRG